MKLVAPDRRYSADLKQRSATSLFLAISVISRHREIIRAQWWTSRRHTERRCRCTLRVTTGKVKYDKVGHAKRNSWAHVDSFVTEQKILGSLQKAFERAGIAGYEVTNEEEALRDLAEHMGYFDYLLVRHGYEENHSVSGCAKTTRR